jgi:hypothetical protein
MAKRKKNSGGLETATPKSIALAERGIHTGSDFASVMSALLTDTIAGRIEPQVSNAVCNISGKLLKVVELQYKYGKAIDGQTDRMLALTPLAPKADESVQ